MRIILNSRGRGITPRSAPRFDKLRPKWAILPTYHTALGGLIETMRHRAGRKTVKALFVRGQPVEIFLSCFKMF